MAALSALIVDEAIVDETMETLAQGFDSAGATLALLVNINHAPSGLAAAFAHLLSSGFLRGDMPDGRCIFLKWGMAPGHVPLVLFTTAQFPVSVMMEMTAWSMAHALVIVATHFDVSADTLDMQYMFLEEHAFRTAGTQLVTPFLVK
jgi:hypothetical protein